MDAGAIVVGKTNLDQFATGLVGTRSPYGVCQNAYNPEYISGGSSSGSAVAVAGGLVSFSLGTDTAGSGRVPAAFNNIVGLKPTLGLVSASGVVPACRSIDCVSIFSGTCAEAELVLKVVAGTDPTDAFSRAASPTSAQVLPLESLRIGIPDQLNFFGNRDAESLFKAACDRVRKMGASIVTIDYAPFRRAGELLYDGPWVAERLLTPGNLLHENPEALRPEIRSILQSGSRYSATDAFRGWYQLAEFRRQAREHWTRMDALLVPTTGTIYRIKEIEADPIQLNRNLGLYTTFVNLLDLSALAVPAGLLPSGLPWGVTFIAPPFHEARLLELGAAFHNHVLSEGQS
jgi:allophanate hydrolase